MIIASQCQAITLAIADFVHWGIYEDFGARSSYLRQG